MIAWPLPPFVLFIGKFIDQYLYAKENKLSIYDPSIKEARYVWRHRLMVFYLAYLASLIPAARSLKEDGQISFSKAIEFIVKEPAFYLSLILWILVISVTIIIYNRFKRQEKFNVKETKIIKEIGFCMVNKNLATKDEFSISKNLGYLNFGITNSIGREVNFTPYDKNILNDELGSYLQEKILQLQINVMGDKDHIYFQIDDVDILKNNLQSMQKILKEITKELKYRKDAKFSYHR